MKRSKFTDNTDWTTDAIVQASLDRWGVEKFFCDSKSRRHISTHPMFHWTNSKIRCHLLTCVMALAMKRLLQLQAAPVHDGVFAECHHRGYAYPALGVDLASRKEASTPAT